MFFRHFFTIDIKKQKTEIGLNQALQMEIQGLQPLMAKDIAALSKKNIEFQDLANLNVVAQKVGESVVVSFGAVSFFDSGNTEINQTSIAVLEKFVDKYLPYSGKYILSIKGFTDKKPVTKKTHSYQDNLELSALRSISAMRFLRTKGIPLRRMEIAGLGELKAIDSILPNRENLSQEEINSISRTLIMVIKPDQGSQH